MKCRVKDCENHSHQGMFVGFLCSPCFTFLNTGEGIYSQLYRNTVAAEREACAQIASWILKMPENDVSTAIRARGQG